MCHTHTHTHAHTTLLLLLLLEQNRGGPESGAAAVAQNPCHLPQRGQIRISIMNKSGTQANVLSGGDHESATCVQRFDDSLIPAIHTTYRISLRSSSSREPRYPLLGVVSILLYITHILLGYMYIMYVVCAYVCFVFVCFACVHACVRDIYAHTQTQTHTQNQNTHARS